MTASAPGRGATASTLADDNVRPMAPAADPTRAQGKVTLEAFWPDARRAIGCCPPAHVVQWAPRRQLRTAWQRIVAGAQAGDKRGLGHTRRTEPCRRGGRSPLFFLQAARYLVWIAPTPGRSVTGGATGAARKGVNRCHANANYGLPAG